MPDYAIFNINYRLVNGSHESFCLFEIVINLVIYFLDGVSRWFVKIDDGLCQKDTAKQRTPFERDHLDSSYFVHPIH